MARVGGAVGEFGPARTTVGILMLSSVWLASAGAPTGWTQPASVAAKKAQAKVTGPARWEAEIRKFEEQDRKTQPPRNAILFVGSSSVRLWKLNESFPHLPTINRGFGGSHLGDVAHFADRMVVKYSPRLIVVYAGDNDLAAGIAPQSVADAFSKLAATVKEKLPTTKLVYLSIKPSPKRWALADKAKEANQRIEAICKQRPSHLTFVNTWPTLLAKDGKPDADLFLADQLHLNAKGYARWRDMLAPVLDAGVNDSSPEPVRRGLVLWLDAVVEGAKRKASAATSIDQWTDQSGADRHAKQADPSKQPTLARVGQATLDGKTSDSWVVRFDGQNDHLVVPQASVKTKDVTLFVVSAPRSNLGFFRALFAGSQVDRRDYETGFNLDLNVEGSVQLQNVNIEGRGFQGARNLLSAPSPFGKLHTFQVTVDASAKQVNLAIDGKPVGNRPASGELLTLDVLTIGSRYYSNDSSPHRPQGFLHGDFAEVLLYDRVLPKDEADRVNRYLREKHRTLAMALEADFAREQSKEDTELLQPVANAPALQMLVPGFSVRRSPLEINNINNVRFRSDGRAYALGYDGDVWLLSDTDNDGLVDKKSRFFENRGRLRGPIGLAIAPSGHALLPGPNAKAIVVASKGKVSALIDSNGDDVAETERVIATGWREIPQNVDAVGVAIHPVDGAIYFGLGTAAYDNAYLLDKQGKSAFDIKSERGTIQRIRPDLSGRDTVCTGVRFVIGMEFDRHNELFVTDQEGATWLPNGNPFDELLHIKPGRHYGFPPRHPTHLPKVFDEPSLVDYGPQHQSTCGMILNSPTKRDGPIFGPPSWAGDALVTGESRGKLYRSHLIRTASGEYLAVNQLIGCLGMLTVDCCVTPAGELLVACHSGPPDWGTGPAGKGTLFQIRYAEPSLPQPRAVWPTGPHEVRVEFDRAIEPVLWKNVAQEAKIVFGEYVSAGDRFETIRPGYAVTQLQMSQPRFKLPVYAASLTADRRSLLLATGAHKSAVGYALTLPGFTTPAAPANTLPQRSQIDLAYSLAGVQATWTPSKSGQSAWSGWLPTLDLDVAQKILDGSPEHQRFWALLRTPGVLTLSTQINTDGLFRPAVQPGSSLSYNPADDRWVSGRQVEIRANRPLRKLPETSVATRTRNDDTTLAVVLDGETTSLAKVAFTVTTGEEPLMVTCEWIATFADGAKRSGPLSLPRYVLPWGEKIAPKASAPANRDLPELAGGNWGRGRRLYFSEEASCYKCHRIAGADVGAAIGPDLSNLIHRDYASVVRDILTPSYSINPDHLTYSVSLKDGRVLTGVLKTESNRLLLGDKEGKLTPIDRSEVEAMKPSATSIMPDDLVKKLGQEKFRDLLAFLLQPAPSMPLDSPLPPPKPRKRADVNALLAGSVATPASELKPIRLLLVAGAKDHGPGEHDYPAWLKSWSELLSAGDAVTVESAMEWPTDQQWKLADVVLFFQRGQWSVARAKTIDAHLAKGGGLIYIHWAVEAGGEAAAFAERIGLASNARAIKYRHGPLQLSFPNRDHPITRNFTNAHFYDESYWLLIGNPTRIFTLGAGEEEGASRPLFWTTESGRGRVLVSILGHYSWTFDDPFFRILLMRGIAWTSRQPIDRFNPLVFPGARMED